MIDTNVVISGLLNPHGPPGRILDLLTSGQLRLLYDDRILAEYRNVLARPRFQFNQQDAALLIKFFAREGEPIFSVPTAIVLPDKDDVPFVEVALSGHADALITGHMAHFAPALRHGVRVRAPSTFLERWIGPSA